jgi:hypothetical protein
MDSVSPEYIKFHENDWSLLWPHQRPSYLAQNRQQNGTIFDEIVLEGGGGIRIVRENLEEPTKSKPLDL